MGDKQDLVVQDATLPATQAPDTFALLQQAVERGMSPEALEKLVALQERVMDRQAKAAFIDAMSRFQSECPEIKKRKEVKNRTGSVMYKFAPLEDIIDQTRDIERECGFVHTFTTSPQANGGVIVSCIVRHHAGHQEETPIPIPATKGINTNAAQDMGIAIKFGMRYAYIGAFGIVTADEDTDGRTIGLRTIGERQVADLRALIDEIGDAPNTTSKLLAYVGAESLETILEKDYPRAVHALEQKRKGP